ncbi:CU044_5270 family protein [Nonomuraea sp. M3C6]|uniref:CU044_5270 family protein n=1 Tax=Nonomuraea marmarensis TaxID=3351344 RepID=A0ABW7A583_9ACTN
MDEDEIRTFADGRPAVPPYSAEARARARERLLAEARGRRRFRLPRLGWRAAAAFGATVVLVGGVAVTLSGRGSGGTGPATSVTQSAAVSPGELDPRPGQYILVESDTMYGMHRVGANGEKEESSLYQTHRKIWQSVDASANGLLLIEGREPKPWPGKPLPEPASKDRRGSTYMTLPSCPGQRGFRRTDYAYLSTLPADAAAMRAHVYQVSAAYVSMGKHVDQDEAAFSFVTDLVRETYLPKAQRDALFEATKTIPGVEVAEGVENSAGRKGVALGRADRTGTLAQVIFDPDTHLYLGERRTVVDAKLADAPEGSVVALTAQLNVSVVDKLPKVKVRQGTDVGCDSPQTQPSASPSGKPVPTPDITVTITATPEPGVTMTATPELTVTQTATPEPSGADN